MAVIGAFNQLYMKSFNKGLKEAYNKDQEEAKKLILSIIFMGGIIGVVKHLIAKK